MTIESLLQSITASPSQAASNSKSKSAPPTNDDDLSALLADNDQQLGKLMQELQKRMVAESPGETEMQKGNEVVPLPGFVIKTVNKKRVEEWPVGLKIFINLTHSPQIPPPPPATPEEIQRALNAQDNTNYKVPLSLTSPRPDTDKSGKTCLVYSACINTDPYEKALKDEDFKLFLIELALEWVEEKYGLELSREFTLPKLTHKGPVQKHVIKRPTRPFIAEVDTSAPTSKKPNPKPPTVASPSATSKSKSTLPTPTYTLTTTPPQNPSTITLEISLPNTQTTTDAILEIEPRRLLLTIPKQYHLDVELPVAINVKEGVARFIKEKRVLRVSLKC